MRASFKEFITTLFHDFIKNSLQCVVLRNYDSLPEHADGTDIDILVLNGSQKDIEACVSRALALTGAKCFGQSNCNSFIKMCIIGQSDFTGESWWGVCLDFNFGLTFQGFKYLDMNIGLETKVYNGLLVVDDECAAILTVVKELLNNNILIETSIKLAKKFVENNQYEFRCLFSPMGKDCLNLLESLIINFDLTGEEVGFSFKNKFYGYQIKTNSYIFFKTFFFQFVNKLNRFKSPSGKVVAILGVDGTGKSTLIHSLIPTLNSVTHNNVIVRHLRPRLLRDLSELKDKISLKPSSINSNVTPCIKPHSARSSGYFLSLVRLLYLTLDYLIGYWGIVRKDIAKKPCIYIFDRYAYDLRLDPRRFRISLNWRFINLFLKIIPEPDLLICLHGEPVDITSRKKELPVDEVDRQTEAIKKFCRNKQNCILINTSINDEKEVRNIALKALKNI